MGSACDLCTAKPSARALFFNRVPKCGSTTLEKLIKLQARKHRFHFERSHDYINNSIDVLEQRRVVSLVAQLSTQKRVLYDRHVLFVDFLQHGAAAPLYINLLRDPLKVQLSAFYFWRECICRTRTVFCRDAWQPSPHAPVCFMDIDQAYEGVTPRPVLGVMTRYFCGQHPVCKAPDPLPAATRSEALRRALFNLRHRYVWVGVLERFEESLRLLRHLLPAYFGDVHVARASKEHVRPTNSTSYSAPRSTTLQKLSLENENDAQVYEYALRSLDCQLVRCGLASASAPEWHSAAHNRTASPLQLQAWAGTRATANAVAMQMLGE